MKSVLFSVLAVVAMATPAKAEVTGISDLFGKYKFTAKIEYTEAGKAYEGQYKETSEVTIEKHGVYDGQIIGLAGRQNGQLINNWDAEKQQLVITNPSQNGVWGDLYMANEKGDYPWNGILEGHNDAFSTYYTYNAADGSISIPDFTLGKGDYQKETFTVCVKFTNVKLELVELEKVDVKDLTGDWHYNAGKGRWDSMEGSTLPTEFDMTVTATNDQKTAYSVNFVYGDFEPIHLDAVFNGSVFSLKLDSTALDVNEKIYLICSYSKNPYQDNVTFNFTEKGALNISSGLTIVRCDSIAPDKPKAQLQWFQGGIAKRQGGEVGEVTWIGTYNFKAETAYPVKPEVFATPKEFSMKVVESVTGLFVTEMFGETLPMGGFELKPDAGDPTKATLVGGYDGNRYLKTIDPGKSYLILGDMNGQADQPVSLTMTADGVVKMANVSVLLFNYETKKSETAGAYAGISGTMEAAPVAPEFSWAQSFKVTAEVEVYNKDYEFPTEFTMTVVTNEYTGGVMLTEFLGGDIAALNYGGAGFTVSETDPLSAAISGGAIMKSVEPGKLYLVLADMNGQNNSIQVTADAEGNLTFANFSVMLKDYDTQTSTAVASFKNVKAVPGAATGIETVQKEGVGFAVVGNTLKLNQAQSVQVYNVTGKCVFNAVASEVSGLVKGVYLVKTATGVAKVMVR